MPEPSPEAVEALFQQAADLVPTRRDSFLDEECAGDPDLRAAVEELLHFDAKAQLEPDFLLSPALLVRTSLPLSTEPGLPSHIGRYRIVRRHGEGGMGTVYEAEQDNPRRTVALKVIRSSSIALATKRRSWAGSSIPGSPRSLKQAGVKMVSRSSPWSSFVECPLTSTRTVAALTRELSSNCWPRFATLCSTPTTRALYIATSNPATSWSRNPANPRCSTLVSPMSHRPMF
jgi:hypothetical protein